MDKARKDQGVINVVGQNAIAIGRFMEGNDRVLSHPAVSGHHALLQKYTEDTWWVTDLNSDHGTYVNNQHVGKSGLPIRLEQDLLWIAPYALRLSTSEVEIRPDPAHLRLDAVNLSREVNSKIVLNLKSTPLSFRPGEFIAVVGGSGAGKSTFLKGLLGMDTLPPETRSGDVYFNNQLLIHDSQIYQFTPMQTIVGYVPQQDDSVHFQLTAWEALYYTSFLRLASDFPKKERNQRIGQVLDLVKLGRTELQNKPIFQLSGGQRKRVNIAMELIADPRILFLDEPTSGLDPGLDLEMMQLLKNWTLGSDGQDPKTIILITHATENIRLCDQIVFLGRTLIGNEEQGGKLIYFGPPDEKAQEFFEKETYSEVYQLVDDPAAAGALHHKLVTQPEWRKAIWERSRSREDVLKTRDYQEIIQPVQPQKQWINRKKLLRQFRVLAARYWKLTWRESSAFVFQMLQGVLVALLLWAVASRDTLTIVGVRSAPTTLFILSISVTWLGILNAAKEIVKERRVFGRERRYGVEAVPYVFSKFVVLGGIGLWQVASLIAATMLIFNPENHTGTFGRTFSLLNTAIPVEVEWFFTLELMLLAGISLGLLISSISKSINQATLLMFPAMLIQILLAGLLFDVGKLSWLSFTHWGLQALGNSLDLEYLFEAAGKASDPILDKLNFSGDPFALAGSWVVLVFFIASLLALTCWRQQGKDKAQIPED